MENHNNEKPIQWKSVIEIMIVIVTIIGSAMYTDSKSESCQNRTFEILDGIRQDMKDFHGRLERQDAEFKAHMIHYQEKRNRK